MKQSLDLYSVLARQAAPIDEDTIRNLRNLETGLQDRLWLTMLAYEYGYIQGKHDERRRRHLQD